MLDQIMNKNYDKLTFDIINLIFTCKALLIYQIELISFKQSNYIIVYLSSIDIYYVKIKRQKSSDSDIKIVGIFPYRKFIPELPERSQVDISIKNALHIFCFADYFSFGINNH